MNEAPSLAELTKRHRRKVSTGALCGLAVLFGLILLAMGWQQRSRRQATDGEPNQMTLAELVKQGHGAKAYVELSNLRFGEHIWLETNRYSGAWEKAWTFLFTDDDPVTPVAVAVVAGGGESGIKASLSQESLRGLAERRPEFYRAGIATRLYEMYPDTKARDAEYFVDVVNDRPSEAVVTYCLAAGAGLVLIGVALGGLALVI